MFYFLNIFLLKFIIILEKMRIPDNLASLAVFAHLLTLSLRITVERLLSWFLIFFRTPVIRSLEYHINEFQLISVCLDPVSV